MSGRNSSRDIILAAAEAVVLKQGAAHLTLDAVAGEAGVSKGGLLYHFPNKEALLQGMIAQRIEQCEEERRLAESRFPGDQAALLKAIVESGLDNDDPSRQINAAALAAVANDPRLLAPVKQHNRKLFKELSAFDQFSRASVVVLAVQGLWLMETLQVSPLAPRQRAAIINELRRLAESAATAGGANS
ncbi:MAG: TetR/AcrR family transcriptional regulator [Verrucomicrobia bacterium]|jgi:AcrR family transcriptional regulator|nr:TetR/AcrR family transcriptional regulator [Verrucomicrobiota bacterium]